MVKRGFWQQNKINAFWSKVGKQTVSVGQQRKKEKFEYHETVLVANKYKAPDLEQVVQEEKYKHLTKEQPGKPGAKPYMAKLYPVPFPQRAEAKKELDRQ
eukprot:7087306-Ditylum_brightwellii.AAC.1